MKFPQQALDALEKYHSTYRHSSLEALRPSNSYVLFPDGAEKVDCWPGPWPGGAAPGVYLIYDRSEILLYVGKADKLATRLSQHFRYATDGSRRCSFGSENWRGTKPAFVFTISVQGKSEAPALEGFLIETLVPSSLSDLIVRNT
jgi:hypothetical protein